MARSFSGDPGAYIPVDYDYLKSLDNEQFKQALTEIFTNIANAINVREAGYFYLTQDNQPFATGGVYFPTDTSSTASNTFGRQVVRKIVFWNKAFPNSGTDTQAHGITFTSAMSGVRVYGCATNPGNNWAPMPNSDVNVNVGTTNITVTTTANYSSYTRGTFVIEYLLS